MSASQSAGAEIRQRTRPSSATAGAAVGVVLGAGAYLVLSFVASLAGPAQEASTAPAFLVGVGLLVCASVLALIVVRSSPILGVSLAATLLAISVVALASPLSESYVSGTMDSVAVVQLGARTYIVPLVAAVLGTVAAERLRHSAREFESR